MRPTVIARRKLATELHLPKPAWADGEEIDDTLFDDGTGSGFKSNFAALSQYVRHMPPDAPPWPIHLRMTDWTEPRDWSYVGQLYKIRQKAAAESKSPVNCKVILTPGPRTGESWNIPGAHNLAEAGRRILATLGACMEYVACPPEDVIIMVGIPCSFPHTRSAPALFAWHLVNTLVALGVCVQINNWGKPGKWEAYQSWLQRYNPDDLWGNNIEYACLMQAPPSQRILEPGQGWMQNQKPFIVVDGSIRPGGEDAGAHFRAMCIHALDVIKPQAISIYRYMPQAEHVAAILDEVWPR